MEVAAPSVGPHVPAPRLPAGLQPTYTPGYNPYTYPMPYGMYNPFGVPFYGPYGAAPLPVAEGEDVARANKEDALAYEVPRRVCRSHVAWVSASCVWQVPEAEERLGYRMQVSYGLVAKANEEE